MNPAHKSNHALSPRPPNRLPAKPPQERSGRRYAVLRDCAGAKRADRSKRSNAENSATSRQCKTVQSIETNRKLPSAAEQQKTSQSELANCNRAKKPNPPQTPEPPASRTTSRKKQSAACDAAETYWDEASGKAHGPNTELPHQNAYPTKRTPSEEPAGKRRRATTTDVGAATKHGRATTRPATDPRTAYLPNRLRKDAVGSMRCCGSVLKLSERLSQKVQQQNIDVEPSITVTLIHVLAKGTKPRNCHTEPPPRDGTSLPEDNQASECRRRTNPA